MAKKLNVAIIGHGFVGTAVNYGFPDNKNSKTVIDPKYKTSVKDLQDKNIDISFVCVPTPMSDDARIDVTILTKTIRDLEYYTDGLIVIKSTVIPSIIDELVAKNPKIIYNPEFLTEKNALDDFVNPIMHVFGGNPAETDLLEKIYINYSICNNSCPIYHMSAKDASFVKYGMNSFLASKVLWFNQFYDIVSSYSGDYDVIRNAIGTDSRIGHSHTMVPGHDGRRSFGGSCFVKDTAAFIMFARDQKADFTVLEEVVRRNQEYRNSYGEPLDREKDQNVKFDYDI